MAAVEERERARLAAEADDGEEEPEHEEGEISGHGGEPSMSIEELVQMARQGRLPTTTGNVVDNPASPNYPRTMRR